MKIHEILTENIFTTDYHMVMDAVAKLYQDHYNVNIWENGEAHDDAAKVLLKVHPTLEELKFIIKQGQLPERFMDLDFPINDDIMYGTGGSSSGDDLDEAHGPYGKKTPQDIERIKRALEREKKQDKPGQLTRPMSPAKAERTKRRDDWIAKSFGESITSEDDTFKTYQAMITKIERAMFQLYNNGRSVEEIQQLDAKIADHLRIDYVNDPMFAQAFEKAYTNFADEVEYDELDEEPASRALCTSGKPDSALGASNLASCKSQGYRAREGGKSHKVGSERVKVRGKRIKGKKYGGPLPDWS